MSVREYRAVEGGSPGSYWACSIGPPPTGPALIGRLYARDDARWLPEVLMDLEDDVGEMARCGSSMPSAKSRP